MLDGLYIRAIGLVCLLVCIATGGLYYGHTRYVAGVEATRVAWDADRARWQSALDKQKHDALALLISAQADVDAANLKAIKSASQQEKDYETYMAGTAALAAQYATRGLRFGAQAPAPARCGPSGGPAVPGAASPPDVATSTVVQLPDPVASNLRQFATDAEDLRNAYRRCVQAVGGGPSL